MMNSNSDIKIIGLDEDRPPVVRKEAYIDLFFRLSQKTSVEWCEDFNKLGNQLEPPVKIDKKNGIFIETWIRDMQLIPAHLDKIKKKIIQCNELLEEKIRQQKLLLLSKNASLMGMDGEQNKLNQIVAELNFDG